MEITVKGEPKEIADLVVAIQGQQKKKPLCEATLTLDGKTIARSIMRSCGKL